MGAGFRGRRYLVSLVYCRGSGNRGVTPLERCDERQMFCLRIPPIPNLIIKIQLHLTFNINFRIFRLTILPIRRKEKFSALLTHPARAWKITLHFQAPQARRRSLSSESTVRACRHRATPGGRPVPGPFSGSENSLQPEYCPAHPVCRHPAPRQP